VDTEESGVGHEMKATMVPTDTIKTTDWNCHYKVSYMTIHGITKVRD